MGLQVIYPGGLVFIPSSLGSAYDPSAVAITGGTITGTTITGYATTGYVDSAVTGLLDLKGSTDCSTNPNYPVASKGDAYTVSVAGKIGGASGTTVDSGDVYYALTDNAGGTEASVGTSWVHIEHNLPALGALATITPGTGIAAALTINAGTTGAPALLGAAGSFTTLAASGAFTATSLALDLPAIASWVALFEANRLTGLSDGDAVATWTDASGNSRNATQATGAAKPTYKAASSGINSQPILRFDGGDYLQTVTGGASLGTDWYVGCVVKLSATNAFQWFWYFGEDTNGHARGCLFLDPSDKIQFNGKNADITQGNPALVSGTSYFVEIVRSSGTITVYVNGVVSSTGAPSLSAFSSAILSIGAHLDHTSPLVGDMAMIGFLGSAPSATVLDRIRGYVEATYGIAMTGGSANFAPCVSSAGLLTRSSLYDNGTDVGFYGRRLAGVSTGSYHYLEASGAGDDVLRLCNKNSAGFSVVYGIGHDVDDVTVTAYGAAFGWGNTSGSPAVFANCTYVETFDSGSATHKRFRLIQTNNVANYRRMEIEETSGDFVWFDRNAAYPSETEVLRFLKAGGVRVVAGLLQFAGATSSFPAFKRSSTTVQARLADDSAFAPLQGKLTTDANATTGLTAGVLSALTNASITITDASGQVYRVPVII